MFDVLLNVVAPVAICIAIGYWWGKSATAYTTEFVTRLVITLGVSLANLAAGNWRTGLLISAVRIPGGVAVSLTAVTLLGIEGLAAKILILQFAMPSAVFNYLFALKHNRDPGAVASGVVISAMSSALVIPVVLWWLLERF